MKYEKLGLALAGTLENYQSHGISGITKAIRTLGVVASSTSAAPPRMVVFVRCDPGARFEHLRTRGIEINQGKGAVRTGIVQLDAVDALTEEGSVERIRSSRKLRPLLDVASAHVHVPKFRQNIDATGNGVLVGIVDSGIDPTHAAFGNRILRIWDQTLQGPGVAGAPYGRELLPAQFAQTNDSDGHGTHVAGIAAGGAMPFSGIAPGASIVMVKTDFDDAHIADGVRYVFRLARELNCAAVVNMSLGGHMDGHDGLDELSAVVDEESGPGRIVCCAAGNEGTDNIHAHADVGAGRTKRIRFLIPPAALEQVILNGWYARGGVAEIAVRSPGRFITDFQPIIAGGNPARRHRLPDGQVTIVTAPPSGPTMDHQFLVIVNGAVPGNTVAQGVWQVLVRNSSGQVLPVDAWIVDGAPSAIATFSGRSASDDMKIGSPGAAASAVTVAAFTTRNQWNDSSGDSHRVGLELNDIADFSSPGPLRTGAQKPDVTAPGAMIVSARSVASAPERSSVVDATHVVEAGTSMASPFIAGIVALLLQKTPELTPPEVKNRLKQSSAIPGSAPGQWDPKWGFGLLDLS